MHTEKEGIKVELVFWNMVNVALVRLQCNELSSN